MILIQLQTRDDISFLNSRIFSNSTFLAVLIQKLIFGHFWNCKKWNLVKTLFLKLIYLIWRVFWHGLFLIFLGHCEFVCLFLVYLKYLNILDWSWFGILSCNVQVGNSYFICFQIKKWYDVPCFVLLRQSKIVQWTKNTSNIWDQHS